MAQTGAKTGAKTGVRTGVRTGVPTVNATLIAARKHRVEVVARAAIPAARAGAAKAPEVGAEAEAEAEVVAVVAVVASSRAAAPCLTSRAVAVAEEATRWVIADSAASARSARAGGCPAT